MPPGIVTRSDKHRSPTRRNPVPATANPAHRGVRRRRAPVALSADAVVDRIWDTARWKPLVLVSCVLDDRPKVSLEQLGSAIGDAAEIIVITASEAWGFQRLVQRGFEAYGGAIRVVLPDATEQDPTERHPLFFTFDNDNPADTVSRISFCLTRNGFTRTKTTHAQKPAGTPRQQRRAQKLRDALRTIDRLEDDNTALAATVHDLRAENADMAEQLAQAKADVDALVDELDEATCPHPIVYSDPEQQLRHEIWLTWLTSTPEADRGAQPLCDYDLGPVFLDSMNLQLVSRGRILDVVVDVLTRRVHQIPARRSHPLRTADAGKCRDAPKIENAYALFNN